jgi:molybdopterin converting factor subunit 1
MIRVTLLWFAALRDTVGHAETALQLVDGNVTRAEFDRQLEHAYPALCGRLGQVRVAVNEAFVDDELRLVSGDVVALIPPVAGG